MKEGRLRALILVAAVVLLHFAAHWAPWSATRTREPLPEDTFAFAANPALVRGPDESAPAAIVRVAHDPAAEWQDAEDVVGRARWRPVAREVFALERAAPWAATPDGAVAGAALVSLLLHALVVLGTARLVVLLGGDGRAALAAGLLAAASPVALSAAAWPARQAVVLATALAVGGALVAVRGGVVRLLAGGVLVALAGLAHEAAFGWALAVPFVVRAASGGRRSSLSAWPVLVAPIAAFALRCNVLHGFGATTIALDAVLDGATGVVAAVWSFLVPARSHFADGPFEFGGAARIAGIAALVAGVALLIRRGALPAAATALAALAALSPLVLVGFVGGAPYNDACLYLALPLLAAATGLAFADLASRAGPLRIAATAAVAMLLGASVAATIVRAPSFRTRAGLVELGKAENPGSLVVRSWDGWMRLPAGPEKLAAEVRGLADDAAASAPRLHADAVAAATVSRFLDDYARVVTVSKLPASSSAYDAADRAAATATDLRPDSARTWLALADLRSHTGALRGAFEAANRAASIAPDDVGVLRTLAEVALAVGQGRLAADTMEHAREVVDADPRGSEPGPEFVLLHARALAADGANLVPDMGAEEGFRYRYDLAAEALDRELKAHLDLSDPWHVDLRGALYDVYLRYGDLLASLDRTAMALISYARAVDLTGDLAKSDAKDHRQWLGDRVVAEEAAARKRITEAEKVPGTPDIANAWTQLYVALCRENRPGEADELFAKLEHELGGIPARLRMHRAVQRYASRDDPADHAKAEMELRQVVREEPTLGRAHFELARVLEWQGTIERLGEASREYEKAARLGIAEEWSIDAADRAAAIERFLLRQGR